jgi:hypothetical protein
LPFNLCRPGKACMPVLVGVSPESGRPPRAIVVSSNTLTMEAVAVASSMTQIRNCGEDLGGAWRLLAGFRGQLYRCLAARADELFDLADAVLCAEGAGAGAGRAVAGAGAPAGAWRGV